MGGLARVFLTDRRARVQLPPGDLDPATGRARLSYRRAAELFEQATAVCPGGPWTLHQLRHSALTHAAEAGANTATLLAYSGHTSVPPWPAALVSHQQPWPAALVSHQQPWPAGKLDATPPPGGVEPPSTPTQRFGEIATVLDMRFADGTVVRVRQPERLDPVSITPGLSIFSASYWNARPPPGRPPRSTCVRKLARTGCATSRPRSSRGHLQ
jgi:hypothetical protein